jgi:indolepyruvate ferredoxin oxidoreductase
VARVRAAEAERAPGPTGLAEAVARNLFKLMTVKDEYEVARLWTDGSFLAQLGAEFDRWDSLEIHLAPPFLAARDAVTGHLKKRRYGPWLLPALRVLARLRSLRGTAFDLFGRTKERRMERQLLRAYEACLDDLLQHLGPENHALALDLARIPEHIRGFGHVKEAHVQRAKAREAELLAAWRGAPALPQAAE